MVGLCLYDIDTLQKLFMISSIYLQKNIFSLWPNFVYLEWYVEH